MSLSLYDLMTPWRSRLHCLSRLRTAGRRSRSWRSQRLAIQIAALRRARVWLTWERPSPSPVHKVYTAVDVVKLLTVLTFAVSVAALLLGRPARIAT